MSKRRKLNSSAFTAPGIGNDNVHLMQPLFISDLCCIIVEYVTLTLTNYCKIFPLLSKYHHQFLVENKHFLAKLIKHEWNKIFIAYPSITSVIQNTDNVSIINAIPRQLNNDPLSLIHQTTYQEINSQTGDEYLIFTLNVAIQSCSMKMVNYWLRKICKIKDLNDDNIKICEITMMTKYEWSQSCDDTDEYASDPDIPRSRIQWKIFNKDSDITTLLTADGLRVPENKWQGDQLSASCWPSYGIGVYIVHYIIEQLSFFNTSNPLYTHFESLMESVFYKWRAGCGLFDTVRILSALFAASMENNTYKLWNTLFSYCIGSCVHAEEEYDDMYICSESFQAFAEQIIQRDDRNVIRKFIDSLDSDLHFLTTHFPEGQLYLYGETMETKDLKPLDAYTKKFDGVIENCEFVSNP